MIAVRELRKSFDGFEALRGLSLTVPEGAVYGLVGPNGAGKSTLIRHLAGICRQDSGEINLSYQLDFDGQYASDHELHILYADKSNGRTSAS